MFTGNVMLVPGQEIRKFTVYRPNKHETDLGRILRDSDTKMGIVMAILAAATTQEKERWRQLEHPITHKIILQYTTQYEILPGDVFVYSPQVKASREGMIIHEQRERRFYNQAMPYDIGDIGHWTIFYCEERTDIA